MGADELEILNTVPISWEVGTCHKILLNNRIFILFFFVKMNKIIAYANKKITGSVIM